MGIETAVGMGIMGAGAIGSGIAQDRANARTNRNAQQRQQQIDQAASGMYWANSPYEAMIMGQIQNMQNQGFDPFNPQAVPTALANIPGLNMNDLFGTSTLNMGNDALAQMIRADPSAQIGASLRGMAETGSPFNLDPVFNALGTQDALNMERAAAAVNGGLTAGARMGSAGQIGRARAVGDIATAANTRNAQIAMGAHEGAQGRILNANQLIGSILNQGNASRLGAVGAAQQFAGMRANVGLANNDMLARIALANAGAQNQMGQFNADQSMRAWGMNNTAQQQQFANLMQTIMAGQGMEAQRNQFNMGLLGIRAGQPMTPVAPVGAGGFGALGDIGSMLMMMQMMNRPMGGLTQQVPLHPTI